MSPREQVHIYRAAMLRPYSSPEWTKPEKKVAAWIKKEAPEGRQRRKKGDKEEQKVFAAAC